jgi:hypothetical protein
MSTDIISIQHDFTEQEKDKLRNEIVAKMVELEQLKANLDQIKKEESGKISTLSSYIQMRLAAFARGSEIRNVRCERRVAGDTLEFIDENGEVVKTEAIPKNYQLDVEEMFGDEFEVDGEEEEK